jgi:hypothetical protein
MFNIIVILFDFQLIYFHLWITNHGISTFDYIVFKREEKAQKEKVKDGSMTRSEFKEWRDKALANPLKPKSKTITKKEKKKKKKEEEEVKQRVEQIKINVNNINLSHID